MSKEQHGPCSYEVLIIPVSSQGRTVRGNPHSATHEPSLLWPCSSEWEHGGTSNRQELCPTSSRGCWCDLKNFNVGINSRTLSLSIVNTNPVTECSVWLTTVFQIFQSTLPHLVDKGRVKFNLWHEYENSVYFLFAGSETPKTHKAEMRQRTEGAQLCWPHIQPLTPTLSFLQPCLLSVLLLIKGPEPLTRPNDRQLA